MTDIRRSPAADSRKRQKAAGFALMLAEHGHQVTGIDLTVSMIQKGRELAAKYGVSYLPSDFKKKDGFNRSIVLSKEIGLYRQNYCGCEYSRREREKA